MAEQDTLARLRRSLARIDARDRGGASTPEQVARVARVALGARAVDAALGGGLPRGAVHEVFAAAMADGGAACGFALGLALRMAGEGRAIVWVQQAMAAREHGGLHPHGLIGFGAAPSVLLVEARDAREALRAAHEAARCPALGAVVLELWGAGGAPGLTASRRLALAAAASGAGLVMLGLDARPRPSAAFSRWRVAAAPSAPLEAGAPGHPCFDLVLLRHRGGPGSGRWHVEWNRDELAFREPALSGAVVSLPCHRPARTTAWRDAG